MGRRNYLIPFAVIVLIWFCLAARARAPETLSIGDCVSLALARHPLIQSAIQRHRAALARVTQAAAFAPPNLAFDSDLQSRPLNFFNSGEAYLGFSQPVEFPGKRSVRKELASREADEARIDLELVNLDVAYQVEESFHEVALAEERLGYSREDLRLSEDFLKHAQARHQAGDIARVDVLRAQVEVSKAANALKSAEAEVRVAKARLNFLLGHGSAESLVLRIDPRTPFSAFDLPALQSEALQSRPEMHRLEVLLDKELLKEKRAKLSKWPDVDLGFARHRIAGEESSWDFTISVPLPFLLGQPRKAEIAEARLQREALTNESTHLSGLIRLEVEEAYMNAQAADEQIRLIESRILKQAEETHELLLFSYAEREIGGIEMIDARRNLLEARSLYAEAICGYNVALSRLEKSVGRKLTESEEESER